MSIMVNTCTIIVQYKVQAIISQSIANFKQYILFWPKLVDLNCSHALYYTFMFEGVGFLYHIL